MRAQCNSCGGEYDTAGKDGVGYFHTCPPEVVTPAVINQTTGVMVTPESRAVRLNVRDERIASIRAGKVIIVAEGDGTTEL